MDQFKNAATTAPSPPNFAASVSYANERVDVLLNRLDQLSTRLCGTSPPEAAGQSSRAVPNGLLDEIMSTASDIAMRADVGIELVNRIERALP